MKATARRAWSIPHLVALGVVAAAGAAVWTNRAALLDEAGTRDVGSAAAAVPRAPAAITALGRIEPKDGVRRIAGPSNPSVVIGRLLVEEGDPVTDEVRLREFANSIGVVLESWWRMTKAVGNQGAAAAAQ